MVKPDAFEKSRMYKLWSDCTMFELRRCRRSDKAHFDFYCGLSQDVGTAIRESRKRHPPADDADLHTCISHKTFTVEKLGRFFSTKKTYNFKKWI